LCLPKPMEMDGADGCLKLTAEQRRAMRYQWMMSPWIVLLSTVLQIHMILLGWSCCHQFYKFTLSCRLLNWHEVI
jgi:hypothetical protein